MRGRKYFTTLYILEGCDRTDCTDKPELVAGMREALGATGKITTWRIDFMEKEPPILTKLFENEWPEWTPMYFPGYVPHPRKLKGLNE